MPVAEEYRLQAAKCARLALLLSDADTRARLLDLQREYIAAAEAIEGGLDPAERTRAGSHLGLFWPLTR
jgi:hypothetical protein